MPTKKGNGENIPVMELSYMKHISFTLGLMDAWPYKELGIKKRTTILRNNKLNFTFWTSLLVLGISYLRKNMKFLSFFDLGQCFITVFMNCIGVQRISVSWTKKYKNVTKDFVYKMHLYHHKDISEHSAKIHRKIEKICSLGSKLIFIQLYSGVIFFNLAPVFYNYKNGMFSLNNRPANGTFEQSVYYDLPFDYTTNIPGFLVVFLANCVLTYECASLFCIFDLYLMIISLHLWGHLKILQAHLESFPRPEMKDQVLNSIEKPPWFTEEESEKVTAELINSIQHHLMIKDFMDQLSNTFGFSIGVYYAYHQVCDTILLLECSQMNVKSLVKYGILTLFMYQQLIQISIIFELLGSQSDSVRDALYGIPWECMDKRNRKIFLIYLHNIQKPLNIKAMGMVPVGVKTMAQILKTSFSYFMFLHTFATRD